MRTKKGSLSSSGSSSDSGFEYYLDRLQQQRGEARAASSLRLLRILAGTKERRMSLTDLAQESRLQPDEFVDWLQKQSEAGLIKLRSVDTEDAESILIELSQKGKTLASAVFSLAEA